MLRQWMEGPNREVRRGGHPAPAPGMVIQHMCIEPVFIFFICKTSDAPAAASKGMSASDQKNKKRKEKIKNIS